MMISSQAYRYTCTIIRRLLFFFFLYCFRLFVTSYCAIVIDPYACIYNILVRTYTYSDTLLQPDKLWVRRAEWFSAFRLLHGSYNIILFNNNVVYTEINDVCAANHLEGETNENKTNRGRPITSIYAYTVVDLSV